MTDKVCKHHPEDGCELILTPEIRHHGKWVCKTCARFVVWARDPKTDDDCKARQARIELILQQYANRLSLQDIRTLLKYYGKVSMTDIHRVVYDKMVERLPVEEYDSSETSSEGSKSCLLD